jgi:hypothetical protein
MPGSRLSFCFLALLICLFRLFFFLNEFQGFLFDIFPGITGLRHHSAPAFVSICNSGAMALLSSQLQTYSRFLPRASGDGVKERQLFPAKPALSSEPDPDAMAGWTLTAFRFWP